MAFHLGQLSVPCVPGDFGRDGRAFPVARCPQLLKWSSDLFACLFQISDRGGGVPLRITDRLFSYMYSTAPTPVMDNSRNAPLVRPKAISST